VGRKAPRGTISPRQPVRMGTMRWISAASLAAVLAAGCGRPEEIAVTPVQAMSAASSPPIDRETPARLETATFAVG